MSNMHSKYGAAAANSVSQLQAQAALSLPGQQRPPNGLAPNVPQDIKPMQQPYPGVAPPQRAPYQPPPQTDGASDAFTEWKAEVARRREYAQRQNQNGEGDRMLMTQLRLDALRMEGGGLMLPLDERAGLPRQISSDQAPFSAQTDGPADDEDEDAINSDLDDPDDLVADDPEGDDAVGQVMLCTYDKVQRVKNKWKCTLKDGILSTGGKE
jgi:transcription initiation factor TFIIA large subunit